VSVKIAITNANPDLRTITDDVPAAKWIRIGRNRDETPEGGK